MQTLRDRADQLMEKHEIDTSDPEDEEEWEQQVTPVYDNGIGEISWFEFVTMVESFI